MNDGVTRRLGDGVNPLVLRVSYSPPLPILSFEHSKLDGSNLLAHKNKITDSKAEKSDGHERNQMRGDDVQALQERKRTLESSQGKSL
jgi:hypothetical protein